MQHDSPPAKIAASDGNEVPETFAAVKITADVLEKPRFEKFPYSGPFPWLDQPDAQDRINGKITDGTLTGEEAKLCRLWSNEGYLILNCAIEPELLDET